MCIGCKITVFRRKGQVMRQKDAFCDFRERGIGSSQGADERLEFKPNKKSV